MAIFKGKKKSVTFAEPCTGTVREIRMGRRKSIDMKKQKCDKEGLHLVKYSVYKNLNIMDIHSVKCANQLTDIMEVNCSTKEVIEDLIMPSRDLEHFFICNLDDIVDKHNTWARLMPRVLPFYAVKCNDNPLVLRLLAALGLGFDCASKLEIQSVLSIGVHPDRIIYAHPVKLISHIHYASAQNVRHNTFDSESELYKCKKYYPNARMVIRIRCDAVNATTIFGAKFGCDPFIEAPELLMLAKRLHLEVVGVSFHVGNGCKDKTAYHDAIFAARYVFDSGNRMGYKFNLLDIGGGFPGERINCLSEYAEVINAAIDKYFPNPSVRIVAEPGTYFVRSAFTLCCSIHGIKQEININPNTNEKTKEYLYYIGDGVFHSFSRGWYDPKSIIPQLVNADPKEAKYRSILWGQTCASLDVVVKEMYCPKAQLGDWFMFDNMGDYSTTVSSNFNGFCAPNIYMTASKSTVGFLKKYIAPELFNSAQLCENGNI